MGESTGRVADPGTGVGEVDAEEVEKWKMNEYRRRNGKGVQEVVVGAPLYVPHYDEVFPRELAVNQGEICKGDAGCDRRTPVLR